ncbi:unnamed protein product [Spirodela intermedia]|uniref:Uncharacterized protein n=1 Tax=Spirodela intermedia TaxID=51605 RepID=A0A7I8I7U9_SPIIN|nr:unnamed protein product [Spirodela intermedia]CAA6653463.1 unnamed protein product [Spirodela intermedia]
MGRRDSMRWVDKSLKDSVFLSREEASFWLGIASLVCWGVAEIPQIITNYRTKSGHGVSFALLFTWLIGDVFNVVGCLLEPATLPTQLYTAWLYSGITVVLVLQTLYFDYAVRWWKYKNVHYMCVNLRKQSTGCNIIVTSIPSPCGSSDVRRSLANSGTPTFGSYLVARSDPAGRQPALLLDSSDDESMTQHRSAGSRTLMAVCASLPFRTKALMGGALAVLSSDESLQEAGLEGGPYGVWLGWIMAAIYTGGRLPQIILNIKRGSLEGLNPVMFLMAVLANVSYVGSILVKSVKWRRIKANAPWLLDAAVCVLLDLLILLQYLYYKSVHERRRRRDGMRDGFGDYEEIK